MKTVPVKILKELEKRQRLAEQLNTSDSAINDFMKNNGLDDSTFTNEYGCMLTTEPSNYRQMTLEFLQNHLK